MKRGENRRWWNDGLSLARHTSESTHIFTVMSVPSPVLIIAVLLPGVVVLNDIMVTLGVNLHSKGTLHVFYSHHVCGSCNHMCGSCDHVCVNHVTVYVDQVTTVWIMCRCIWIM